MTFFCENLKVPRAPRLVNAALLLAF